jgi:hypothetical protein
MTISAEGNALGSDSMRSALQGQSNFGHRLLGFAPFRARRFVGLVSEGRALGYDDSGLRPDEPMRVDAKQILRQMTTGLGRSSRFNGFGIATEAVETGFISR